jgi:peptide/nickel transport system permease protein
MREYVIRRLLATIPVLLLVSFTVFMLIRFIPGDPVSMMLASDPNPSQERIDSIRKELGLDVPVWKQYVIWLGGIVRGDWGTSIRAKEPVLSALARRIPVTVELGAMAVFFSILIALPVGIISALYQDRWPDYILRVFSITGLALPGFWLATLVVVLPTLWLNVTPIMSYTAFTADPWRNFLTFVVPAATMGFGMSAIIARMVRSSLLEVFREDYVRTARAKGLGERAVIWGHALKNAMIPVITLIGAQTGVIIGGAVVIEQIFSLPGVGRLALDSIYQRDYPQLQGNVLFLATAYVLINIIVDISYAWIDPRIRFR